VRLIRYGWVIAGVGVLVLGDAHRIHWLAVAVGLGATVLPIMDMVIRQQHPLELDRERPTASAKPLG
jgi:hypothetical protein